jgi:hypothetical protein
MSSPIIKVDKKHPPDGKDATFREILNSKTARTLAIDLILTIIHYRQNEN